MAESPLEGVAPIQHYIDPVAAFARPTIRSGAAIDLVAKSKVIASLADAVIEVSRVVPEDIDTGAHPRRDEVPQIPLSQENRIAMELRDTSANPCLGAQNVAPAGCVATTNVDVGALKVRAEQNRTGRRGRTGQEPFRTPEVRITADQPAF